MRRSLRRVSAAGFVVASLTMLVVVAVTGEHTTFELLLEIATWIAATVAIAVVLWR